MKKDVRIYPALLSEEEKYMCPLPDLPGCNTFGLRRCHCQRQGRIGRSSALHGRG